MAITVDPKDPDEVLDYKVDWTARLAGDTITSSVWEVPTGIIKNSDTNDSTSTTIWLSGGTLNATYALTNRVVTAGGRTFDQTISISCRER